MDYYLKQYGLHQGALEIQYIEEFFLDFPKKKTAAEVIKRLTDRDHQILMAEASLPDPFRGIHCQRVAAPPTAAIRAYAHLRGNRWRTFSMSWPRITRR